MVETPYFQSFHDFCVWDYDYDYYCGLDRSVSFNHSPQKESMQSTFHVVCGCPEYRIWLKTGLSTQSQSIYRVTRGWCGKRTICLRYTSPLAHLYFLRGRPTALICVYQTECVWQSTPIVVLRTTSMNIRKCTQGRSIPKYKVLGLVLHTLLFSICPMMTMICTVSSPLDLTMGELLRSKTWSSST